MKVSAVALVAILVMSLVSSCFAGHTNSKISPGAKMTLHLDDYQKKRKCETLPTFASWGDIQRRKNIAELSDFDVVVVVFDYGTGITGVEYGLTWPGAWLSAITTPCGEFQIGDIADPGDGIAITWSTCVSGDFYFPVAWSVLSPSGTGHITLVENPVTGFMGVTDCDFVEDYADTAYNAAINVAPDSVYAEPTTWGSIKAMFK